MTNESKWQGGGRLKGLWGAVEVVCVAVMAGVVVSLAMSKTPAGATSSAAMFRLVELLLCVLAVIGLAVTQWLRFQIHRDPTLRERYITEKSVAKLPADAVLLRENWAPWKKWLVLVVIASALLFAFIAALMLFAR